jgi:hypothetical protein
MFFSLLGQNMQLLFLENMFLMLNGKLLTIFFHSTYSSWVPGTQLYLKKMDKLVKLFIIFVPVLEKVNLDFTIGSQILLKA